MEQEPIWEDRGNMPDFEREYWDEDDWERFMDEQDRKVDEIMRLDDLFLNSGMESRDLELMGFEPCDKNCTECEERYSCWEYQERVAEESRKATGAPEPERKSRLDEFREIPVYGMCFEFGVAAMKWLHHIPLEDRESEPAFRKLGENCGIPGAKIAGGHGMGYGPDTICGNVVKCKKAAAALTASIEALGVLSEREDTAEKASSLKQEAESALKELRVRIEELRAEARRLHGKSD